MPRVLYHVYVLLVILSSCSQRREKTLAIAVAANVQYAMEELTTVFTNESGIPCELIVGSSGKLTAQIREGAPFDVFVSADMKYPAILYGDSMTTLPPRVYGYGALVLWTSSSDLDPEINVLEGRDIHHIAIANPKTAPYGEAAVQALNYFQLYEAVKHKLVFGESISQTNRFIESGAAEIGFTAKSIVLSPGMSGKGKWIELDQQAYTPIAQTAVIIRHTEVKEEAKKFYTFLFSSRSREILNKYGYITNEP